jgi:hypothetical protein
LSQPLLFAFISLNPGLSAIRSYFNNSRFLGDFAGLGPSGVSTTLDNQLQNLASTVQSGLDFSADYRLPTDYGEFNFRLSGMHLLSDRIRAADYVPWVDVDNTIGEPTSWKVRAGVDWERDGFATGISINHVNGYQNTLFTPSQSLASWTTTDVYLSYKAGAAAPFLTRNLNVTVSVQNVGDRRPPLLQIPSGDLALPIDEANASAVGRLVSLQVTKGW